MKLMLAEANGMNDRLHSHLDYSGELASRWYSAVKLESRWYLVAGSRWASKSLVFSRWTPEHGLHTLL